MAAEGELVTEGKHTKAVEAAPGAVAPAASDSLVVNGVDTADVPSAAWGWSNEYPRLGKIAGVIIAVILLCMLVGNHRGHVEEIYLVGFAGLILLIVGVDLVRGRRPR